MKKFVVGLFFLASVLGGYAQGFVNFNTAILGTSAHVYTYLGTLASGTEYFAQLYAADGSVAGDGVLVAKGTPVNFRSGTAAGYVQSSGTTSQGITVNPAVQVTSQSSGSVTLQLRMWNSAFSSYEAAVAASNGNAAPTYGKSGLLVLTPGYAPNPPSDLIGLGGFTVVPEPSAIALGVLGAGSLLFICRQRVIR